jgi:hypothetical protein
MVLHLIQLNITDKKIVNQLSKQQKEMMMMSLSIVMTLTLASCAASPSSIQPDAVRADLSARWGEVKGIGL